MWLQHCWVTVWTCFGGQRNELFRTCISISSFNSVFINMSEAQSLQLTDGYNPPMTTGGLSSGILHTQLMVRVLGFSVFSCWCHSFRRLNTHYMNCNAWLKNIFVRWAWPISHFTKNSYHSIIATTLVSNCLYCGIVATLILDQRFSNWVPYSSLRGSAMRFF